MQMMVAIKGVAIVEMGIGGLEARLSSEELIVRQDFIALVYVQTRVTAKQNFPQSLNACGQLHCKTTILPARHQLTLFLSDFIQA